LFLGETCHVTWSATIDCVVVAIADIPYALIGSSLWTHACDSRYQSLSRTIGPVSRNDGCSHV